MMTLTSRRAIRAEAARRASEIGIFALAAIVVAQSATLAKRSAFPPALVAVDDAPSLRLTLGSAEPVGAYDLTGPGQGMGSEAVEGLAVSSPPAGYPRYFDGRPIRPVKTIWMTVTAYSPDEKSCGEWADGYTATNHSVWTNAMKLVAADTKLLPFGSMVSVPGYADGEVVPVLDRGGAIKGRRLDVLYPTHESARKWGVRRLPVTVWEFADGGPTNLGHRGRR